MCIWFLKICKGACALDEKFSVAAANEVERQVRRWVGVLECQVQLAETVTQHLVEYREIKGAVVFSGWPGDREQSVLTYIFAGGGNHGKEVYQAIASLLCDALQECVSVELVIVQRHQSVLTKQDARQFLLAKVGLCVAVLERCERLYRVTADERASAVRGGRHIRGATLTVVSRRDIGRKLGAPNQHVVVVGEGYMVLKP